MSENPADYLVVTVPQNILNVILETKRKETADLHARFGLVELKALAHGGPPPRDFYGAISGKPCGMVNLIAEVKKASPSAGVIREDFDPVDIARRYAAGGADALSVLTDAEYFQGSLEYLRDIRAAVSLPILRKDFIIDPWQVYESRGAGADAILLIAAALDTSAVAELADLAIELGMSVLVEVHSRSELDSVRPIVEARLGRCLLGINNRDLTTFSVDIATTLDLAATINPAEVVVVSESGIRTSSDVERPGRGGVRGILVGETLMRCDDIAAGIEELLAPPCE